MGPNCPNCNADHTNIVDDGWHVFECGSRAFFCIDGKVKALPSSLCNRMVALAAENERLRDELAKVAQASVKRWNDLTRDERIDEMRNASIEHPDTARLREVGEAEASLRRDLYHADSHPTGRREIVHDNFVRAVRASLYDGPVPPCAGCAEKADRTSTRWRQWWGRQRSRCERCAEKADRIAALEAAVGKARTTVDCDSPCEWCNDMSNRVLAALDAAPEVLAKQSRRKYIDVLYDFPQPGGKIAGREVLAVMDVSIPRYCFAGSENSRAHITVGDLIGGHVEQNGVVHGRVVVTREADDE